MLDNEEQKFFLPEVDDFFSGGERRVLKSVFDRKLRHAYGKFDGILKQWQLQEKDIFPSPESVFAFIDETTFKRFRRDLERFKERYKESIEETIKRAENGDSKAFFRLIEWDKAFLGSDFIVQKVVEAEYNDTRKDRDFLERLADKFSARSKIIRKKPFHQDVICMVEFFTLGSSPSHEQLKQIHSILEEQNVFHDKNDISPLSDFSYFKKYLKRNGVIT